MGSANQSPLQDGELSVHSLGLGFDLGPSKLIPREQMIASPSKTAGSMTGVVDLKTSLVMDGLVREYPSPQINSDLNFTLTVSQLIISLPIHQETFPSITSRRRYSPPLPSESIPPTRPLHHCPQSVSPQS